MTASQIYERHNTKSYKSDRFANEFGANIRHSSRVMRKHISSHMPMTVMPRDDAINHRDVYLQTQDVPVIEIELAVDDYERLIDTFSDIVYYRNYARKTSEEIKRWEQADAFSAKIRSKHPAVQKAYEKYMTLFNLMRNDCE